MIFYIAWGVLFTFAGIGLAVSIVAVALGAAAYRWCRRG